MLRDAVILLRPIEVRKLIEIGANINCNQFPQVKRLRIIPRLYSIGIILIKGRRPTMMAHFIDRPFIMSGRSLKKLILRYFSV